MPSPALTALFNSIVAGQNTTWQGFDLYAITPAIGSPLYFTTADFDIAWQNNTYKSGGVRVDTKRSKAQAHWKCGLDVDTWVVALMPRPINVVTGAPFPDVIGTVPWIEAASNGAIDAADIVITRVYFNSMPIWPIAPTGAVPIGGVVLFAGVVAELDMTDLSVVMTLNDYRSLLTIQMPLHFYQWQCRHTLFDVGCNADGNMVPSLFAVAGVASAGSTQELVVASASAPAGSGTFSLGTMLFTSGLNAGFRQTITAWNPAAGNFLMTQQFPFAIAPGDTFFAYPGCDWTYTTCSKFGNSNNYGGQPFIPSPETANN